MSASKYSRDEMLAVFDGKRYEFCVIGVFGSVGGQCLICDLRRGATGRDNYPAACWTNEHCRCTPEIRKDAKRGYWKEAP